MPILGLLPIFALLDYSLLLLLIPKEAALLLGHVTGSILLFPVPAPHTEDRMELAVLVMEGITIFLLKSLLRVIQDQPCLLVRLETPLLGPVILHMSDRLLPAQLA